MGTIIAALFFIYWCVFALGMIAAALAVLALIVCGLAGLYNYIVNRIGAPMDT